MLLCGRYEGFDERVHTVLANDEVSLGPFVLAGGEVAAMAVIDAVARRLEGALGNAESLQAESFSEALGGRVEHPQYTRPASFLGHEVPARPALGRPRGDRPLARGPPGGASPARGLSPPGAPPLRRPGVACYAARRFVGPRPMHAEQRGAPG